ncbi:hypothetical protein DL98DRAFT_579312 [Cadophora sp. DSE1049]|nr:hypothetical protein DL98DRAFT_579312 [Cadophora sp. DSE1049]
MSGRPPAIARRRERSRKITPPMAIPSISRTSIAKAATILDKLQQIWRLSESSPAEMHNDALGNMAITDGVMGYFYVNPALIPLPTDYDQFLNNFGSEVEPNNMLHTHYAIHNGAYHDLPADPFEQGLLVPIPSMEDGGFSADAGPDLEYSANDRNQLEKSGQAMVSDPIGNSRTRIPSPNQQEGSDTNNHHLTSPPPAAVIHSSSTPQFAEQLSRGSIIAPEQPESPRNAEGHYICVGFGCSNEKTFRIRSDWQTHVNQHTRPYICSVEGCPYRSATKGVLVRHKLLKHSLRRSASSDLFGVSGTDTSSGPGREPALTSAHGTPAVIYKGKGKAKRKFTDDEDEEKSNNDRNEQGSGSRMVQKTAKRTGCGSTQREEELAQENEKLRQELKKAHEELVYYRAERDEEKKERKTLQGIFDRVTKQMT